MLDTILTIGAMFSALAALVDFILVLSMLKILNTTFDPKFKVNLNKWTWLSWSQRVARAFQYASWVAQKSVKTGFVKTAIGYDFRSKVSPEIYRRCRIHLYLFWIWMGLMFPIGLYYCF